MDVGSKRIGIAAASMIARLPRPVTTLENDPNFLTALKDIINNEGAGQLIIGLPRGLEGQETDQTRAVRDFASMVEEATKLPIHFQDEAVTSEKAIDELNKRGRDYSKGDVDSLAATYILEDWLTGHVGEAPYV